MPAGHISPRSPSRACMHPWKVQNMMAGSRPWAHERASDLILWLQRVPGCATHPHPHSHAPSRLAVQPTGRPCHRRRSSAFVGSGYSLSGAAGSDPAQRNEDSKKIRHSITFYKNGFVVDDGPLRDMQDPANAAFLNDINQVCRLSATSPSQAPRLYLSVFLSLAHTFDPCLPPSLPALSSACLLRRQQLAQGESFLVAPRSRILTPHPAFFDPGEDTRRVCGRSRPLRVYHQQGRRRLQPPPRHPRPRLRRSGAVPRGRRRSGRCWPGPGSNGHV